MDNIKNFKVNSSRWLSLDDFEGEIWKDIPKFEGWYKISNYGRVKTESRKIFKKGRGGSIIYRIYHPHIMKAHDNGHGYLLVILGGRKRNRYYIHRLVAAAFIPNQRKRTDVDHVNTNRWDNTVTNLRWVSKSENAMNPITLEKNRIMQSNPVVLLDCWGEYIGEFFGAQDLANFLGIERTVVNDVMSQRRCCRFANGYTVVRKKDYDPNKDYTKLYKRGTSNMNFIPNERMVLVFKEGRLASVFQNTQIAAFFYKVKISWISKLCRDSKNNISHFRNGCVIKDKLYYLKDVSPDIQKEALEMFK